jgi:hypothetical protein
MLFLIGGCFLATALLVILVPILLPMAKSFGGTCLFIAGSIAREPLFARAPAALAVSRRDV